MASLLKKKRLIGIGETIPIIGWSSNYLLIEPEGKLPLAVN